MTFGFAGTPNDPTPRRSSSASCSAPPTSSGEPATSKTISVLPAHPPPSEVRCQCREAPRANRLQVKDVSKARWGTFFYKCAKAKCSAFIWEELPEEKGHWPWVLGPTLPSKTGEFRVNPTKCDHPLDMLKGMGGTRSAIACEMCGGRWEKGPAGDMILGTHRKKTLMRVKAETYEEVFGAFQAPGTATTATSSSTPPSAATGATPKAPSRTTPGSSRKENQEKNENRDMKRMMAEMKKELEVLEKKDERQRKTRSRGHDEDYVMEDEEERTGPLNWETDSDLSR